MSDAPAPTLSGQYDPKTVEPRWYQWWTERGFFHAEDTSERPAYCIAMPPPNVTGSLHMGHALTATLQDVLIRYKRMSGYNALWMPGTDHAGIATQMVVERELGKQGLKRQDLGRDAFLAKVWEWKAYSHGRITEQHKRLGISCDWERERFTMDEGLSDAVREVFVRLWEDGLLYRSEKLVNWSPSMQTVISDLEVESAEEDGALWHLAYPVAGSDERLVVATTRPETMLGDTAVAVHPEDPRYQHLIGKSVALPLTDRLIPIIGDAILVDMAFGTGAVKVTPAHDFNDFETGRRHALPMLCVLDKDARINENAPREYQGLDRFEARKRIVADLEAAGLLVETKPHKLNIGRSQRSGEIVEPMLSFQWFVRAGELAKEAIRVVESGEIQILPEHWTKTYYHWMYNIRDWCVSRQLWWGHRIPAWYCGDCAEVTVARVDPTACAHCGSASLSQDEDVLDTWFSSALWPFSTLGWPRQSPALQTFYPNTVMETGHDILFFWVARMIMMGCKFMGGIPFKTVYLHAMVRDEHGHKMSKSKGNVIDPLDLVDRYGADALRFTLAALTVAGRSIKLSDQRVEGYRNFASKIWNASRFVMMHLEGADTVARPASLGGSEKWILTRLADTSAAVQSALDAFDFGEAAAKLYQFFWGDVCDWYIELSKVALQGDGRAGAQWTLRRVLDGALRLLHPFMPHLTEELWQRLPRQRGEGATLMREAFILPDLERFPEEAATFDTVIRVVESLRTLRGENNVPPSAQLHAFFNLDAGADDAALIAGQDVIRRLGRVSGFEIVRGMEAQKACAVTRSGPIEIIVPLAGLVDLGEERRRLEKVLKALQGDIEKVERKLGDDKFMSRAPADVVQKEREKLERMQAEHATAQAGLARLG